MDIMSKYGTVNFKAPLVSVSSSGLDEKAERAREKQQRGEELTWSEEWLLRDYIGGIRVDEDE